jgi:hypothetical protein
MNDNRKPTPERIAQETSELNEKFGAILEGQCTEAGINSLVWMLANVVIATVKPEDLGGATISVIGNFMKALAVLQEDDDSPSGMVH